MNGLRTVEVSAATRIALWVLAFWHIRFAAILGALPLSVGVGSGGWTVVVPAAAMAGFGVFASFALVAAIRSRLTLNSTMLEATVVSGHSAL